MFKFEDHTDLAVISTASIINGSSWISVVTHDKDDGGWQFLEANNFLDESAAVIVSLGEVLAIDETLWTLADLPAGWLAWRSSRDDAWRRCLIKEAV